jgi:cobalt-zinc-cadmium efflux system protein
MSAEGRLSSQPKLKYLRIALILNITFTIIEAVGGFITNSMAILTDALHDAGDAISLSLALYFQYMSRKGSDKTFTYGYRRFSLLGALLNGFILFAGSLFLIAETVQRLQHPEDVKPTEMIGLAIFGAVMHGIAAWQLRKGSSLNEKMAGTHLLEDTLGWIAVLIAATVMHFYYIPILDPILSLLILGWILFNVFRNLSDVFRVILQAVPKGIDQQAIKRELEALPGVKKVDDLHIWSLDGEYNIVSLHLMVPGNIELDALTDLKAAVRDVLKHDSIEHVTIEFSTLGEPEEWHAH